MSTITISPGFDDAERNAVAAMYWQAFGPKLGLVLGPEARAIPFFADALNPGYALAARGDDGQLLGIAGFKTQDGALVEGGWRNLVDGYGLFSALWRAPILSVLERGLEPDTLLMDGIFVTSAARGRGVGTLLLGAVRDEALRRDLSQVRLDVIDTNPRARALYERFGFEPRGQEQLGPLRHIFGFASSTRMVLPLADAAN